MTIEIKLQRGSLGGKGLGALIDTSLPKKAADRFAKKAGKIVQREIAGAITARSQRPTGKLARSFRVTPATKGGLVSLDVRSFGPASKYARIQDRGGIIRAKSSPYLHFRAYSGRWVRTKQVKLKPKRYLSFAASKARPKLSALLRTSIATQARERR